VNILISKSLLKFESKTFRSLVSLSALTNGSSGAQVAIDSAKLYMIHSAIKTVEF